MNQSASNQPRPAAEPQPLILALALATRVNRAFGECFESTRLIIGWLRAELQRRFGWSRAIAAIDDPLERAEPLLRECLANDPPAKRRQILNALRETHRRTETLAAAIDPQCPARLMEDQ